VRFEVTDADTATTLGTGAVPVLATSRLVTWMEATTVQSAEQWVEAGQTTVGTAVRIEHHRATPLGGSVEVIAEPSSSPDGRRLTFVLQAFDSAGKLVGAGEIDRAIVDRERFLRRATSRPEADRRSPG
jgi:fluoroacetyl-CoA thioesterase